MATITATKPKFTLALIDGTTKTYSRRIDALRAADKAGQPFTLANPKGEIVAAVNHDLPAVEDVDCGGCNNAEHCMVSNDLATCTCCGAGNAPEAPEAPAAPAAGLRTFDATDVTEYTCAGACGETKPVTRFVTRNNTPLRYTECRVCATARRAAARKK